ncbi:putative F-box/kelch-repeat protein [Cardamine amara subsp. amara]|uniref:F-box/kelch-repeat protein n=1 Tax=Cardamine amara subsp. amara TaxID=228776 RepID=A0ABD0ZP16_CARAN
MVKITEIASDGGDPNKKPQKEDNQNENTIQQRVQNLPIDPPDDIVELILELVERCDYPNLSCINKTFHRVVFSPELFERRSSLGRTEHFLYTFIGFPSFGIPRWYILHRRNNSLRLSMIGSLPPLIPGSAVVTIGHEIYIFGGKLNPLMPPVPIVIVIDCRFHTWRRLPDMKRARCHAAAGVVDGKIYVIGGCVKQGRNWIEVFDVSSEIWGTVPDHQYPRTASFDGVFGLSVVMEDKIYILDRMCCLVYEPRRRRWESWGLGSQQRACWHWSSCVIDDMLYTIDPTRTLGYPILVFDPRDVVWRPVKGVGWSDLLNLAYFESRMANLGGKLVILGRSASMYGWDYSYMDSDIWCIVIALEKREDGEILGNVETRSRVLSCFMLPLIEHCRTVTV